MSDGTDKDLRVIREEIYAIGAIGITDLMASQMLVIRELRVLRDELGGIYSQLRDMEDRMGYRRDL